MGKPAARLMDTTAHGGMITGPGCPTVLIGKMPAARIGDMHVCPMVTPAVPPIPHVGGPIVGPGCPTVLIGKMPAVCLGDMAICVGPPSTIIMGCPTVLIGPSGAGGGGGGGGSTATAQKAKTTSGKTPKTIKGLETAPIEIQQAMAEAAKVMTPEQLELQIKIINDAIQQAGGGQKEDDKKPLTIKDLADILEAIESEEGYEAARFFASHLDFIKLTYMAMGFISGRDTDANNDPNVMPTRFMILYGADDSKLQQIDDHPDKFENEEHKINVANLRKGLKLLGYEVKDSGPYDEELLREHIRYIATTMSSRAYPYDELEDDEELQKESGEEKETGTLSIKLDIDPNDPVAQDDTFSLYSTDSKKTYKQVKTVKDDADSKNNTLELVFTGLDKALNYTLEIDPGSSGKVEYLFRNRKYGKWV